MGHMARLGCVGNVHKSLIIKNAREGTGWEISYVRRDNIKMDLTC